MVLAAVGQICSTSSLGHNLAQCQKLVAKAAAAGAKALFLPEASDYIALNAAESLSLAQPLHTSPFVLGLRDSAKEYSMDINVGVHEPSNTPSPINTVTSASNTTTTAQANKLLNTLLWINSRGEISHTYSKLHLFDVDLSPHGPILKESDSVQPGTTLTPPIPTPLGPLGLLICFDIRFPEPSLSLRRQGAKLLVYPSAFTVPTGRAHWELLLRARAVETQSYVIASAQCGPHNEKRVSWGESLVVGPWGQVLGRLGSVDDSRESGEGADEPELWVGEIELDEVDRVRREVPLKRRTDVYAEV